KRLDRYREAAAPRICHAAFSDANSVIAVFVDDVVKDNTAGAAILFARRKIQNPAGGAAAFDLNTHLLIGLRPQHKPFFVAHTAQITASPRHCRPPRKPDPLWCVLGLRKRV